ncbi:MAG: hypothetical protein GXP16_13885 [Gammaproteobacteria bacterium]|nr:hypothetical protein [Gammaproteobacteria bacterium]
MKLKRFRLVSTLLFVLCFTGISSAWAQGQFIDLFPKTADDIELILATLEKDINQTPDELSSSQPVGPILMMLHGKQAHRFLRGNYAQNKTMVDKTAQLSAHGLIEVKICKTWLHENQFSEIDLFPFIGTVNYGASELARLIEEEGYTEFSVNL